MQAEFFPRGRISESQSAYDAPAHHAADYEALKPFHSSARQCHENEFLGCLHEWFSAVLPLGERLLEDARNVDYGRGTLAPAAAASFFSCVTACVSYLSRCGLDIVLSGKGLAEIAAVVRLFLQMWEFPFPLLDEWKFHLRYSFGDENRVFIKYKRSNNEAKSFSLEAFGQLGESLLKAEHALIKAVIIVLRDDALRDRLSITIHPTLNVDEDIVAHVMMKPERSAEELPGLKNIAPLRLVYTFDDESGFEAPDHPIHAIRRIASASVAQGFRSIAQAAKRRKGKALCAKAHDGGAQNDARLRSENTAVRVAEWLTNEIKAGILEPFILELTHWIETCEREHPYQRKDAVIAILSY